MQGRARGGAAAVMESRRRVSIARRGNMRRRSSARQWWRCQVKRLAGGGRGGQLRPRQSLVRLQRSVGLRSHPHPRTRAGRVPRRSNEPGVAADVPGHASGQRAWAFRRRAGAGRRGVLAWRSVPADARGHQRVARALVGVPLRGTLRSRAAHRRLGRRRADQTRTGGAAARDMYISARWMRNSVLHHSGQLAAAEADARACATRSPSTPGIGPCRSWARARWRSCSFCAVGTPTRVSGSTAPSHGGASDLALDGVSDHLGPGFAIAVEQGEPVSLDDYLPLIEEGMQSGGNPVLVVR